MIAIDTNILVYAHLPDSPFHEAASAALARLVTGSASFAIPWPCIGEFMAVTTNPKIWSDPSANHEALAAVQALQALPQVRFLHEASDHLEILASLLKPGVVGPKVHDAKIAAICLSHGITELWTADRDFSYFPALRTRNPLI